MRRIIGAVIALLMTVSCGGVGGIPTANSPTSPSAEQVIGYHGLDLAVPASWTINDTMCGTPQGDTLIRDEDGGPACLVPEPPGVSSVEIMVDPASWVPEMQSIRTITNAHGVELQQGTEPDLRGIAIYVPAVQVLMRVDTVAESEAAAIVDSITTVDTDPNGCAMQGAELDPPASYQPPASMTEAMIPGSPSSIAICHYVDNWLTSSASVTGQALTDLIGVVNRLPEGFVYPPSNTYDPSDCGKSSAAGGERKSGFVLWTREANEDPVSLWAHIGFCGHLGITNGARDAQLTRGLAETFADLLHIAVEFPGRRIPDAS